MYGFEINKILASIIIAIILLIVINVVGNYLTKYDHNKVQETAYKIEIPETSVDISIKTAVNNEKIESVSSLMANASLDEGKKVFKKCATCHNYKKDSKSKIGPNLWNLIDRSKAGISGFAYSKEIKEHGGKWTYEELNGFLYKPKEYIKGTKMNFAGLTNVEDRANVILWLRQHSDNPVPLP